jgi:hypothetical protein
MIKLNPLLFWDCDYTKIDFEKNYGFVVERVLERGSFDDWFAIKKYYGIEKIKQAALNARYLSRKVLAFCSTIFDTPQEEFRCYKLMSSSPERWIF